MHTCTFINIYMKMVGIYVLSLLVSIYVYILYNHNHNNNIQGMPIATTKTQQFEMYPEDSIYK